MRWSVFVVALAATLVADAALGRSLDLVGITPLLSGGLATFVVLLAARPAEWGAALVTGLTLDLSSPEMWELRPLHVPGPWALGFAFGAFLLLQLRGSLMRRNPLTVGAATALLLAAATLPWAAIWSLRAWYPGSLPPWGDRPVTWALWERIWWALWSGAVCVPLAWLLLRTLPAWGFAGLRRSPARVRA